MGDQTACFKNNLWGKVFRFDGKTLKHKTFYQPEAHISVTTVTADISNYYYGNERQNVP